jgi:hypothetical protein
MHKIERGKQKRKNSNKRNNTEKNEEEEETVGYMGLINCMVALSTVNCASIESAFRHFGFIDLNWKSDGRALGCMSL